MIAQVKPPSAFWSQQSLDALTEWLILVGLILGVAALAVTLGSQALKWRKKRRKDPDGDSP